MDYNQLIGLVRETNRPPGGLRTVAEVAREAFLRPDSNVLEIGTSTGITAVELARLAGCSVTGIDINSVSLREAAERASASCVDGRVTFRRLDATDTGFDAASFDLVFAGNVTSLISDRERALGEYVRVVRTGGFIAAVPMYYIRDPSEELIGEVSRAIQVEVEPHDREFWVEFFTGPRQELYWTRDFRFVERPSGAVDAFVDAILSRPHLASLTTSARTVLASRYREFMHLFNRNLSHMGYTVMLVRSHHEDAEPELFRAMPV